MPWNLQLAFNRKILLLTLGAQLVNTHFNRALLIYSLWQPGPLILIEKKQTKSNHAEPAPYQMQAYCSHPEFKWILRAQCKTKLSSCITRPNLLQHALKDNVIGRASQKTVKRWQKKQLQHSFFPFIVWDMPVVSEQHLIKLLST